MTKQKTATPEQKIADALRRVAVRLTTAVESQYLSRSSIDPDLLHETLMAVADELDPEFEPIPRRPLGMPLTMTLRRRIGRVPGLAIDDETSDNTGFAVQDQREEIGDGVCTWVASLESLQYLIHHGGIAHLASAYNGSPAPIRRTRHT